MRFLLWKAVEKMVGGGLENVTCGVRYRPNTPPRIPDECGLVVVSAPQKRSCGSGKSPDVGSRDAHASNTAKRGAADLVVAQREQAWASPHPAITARPSMTSANHRKLE